jgi:hypothetical protein
MRQSSSVSPQTVRAKTVCICGRAVDARDGLMGDYGSIFLSRVAGGCGQASASDINLGSRHCRSAGLSSHPLDGSPTAARAAAHDTPVTGRCGPRRIPPPRPPAPTAKDGNAVNLRSNEGSYSDVLPVGNHKGNMIASGFTCQVPCPLRWVGGRPRAGGVFALHAHGAPCERRKPERGASEFYPTCS